MMVESGGSSSIINDNYATGDYSVGCYQVNILGALARNRPSEAELKDPTINVRWAYQHWLAEGKTFCKTSGWYNTCKKLGERTEL